MLDSAKALYDLSVDPGEKNNLYGQNPEVFNALNQLMISYIENGRSTIGERVSNEPVFGNKWKQIKVFDLN